MRLLYFILYISFQYALRLFFKRTRTINSPREWFGRTIYVSNHPASFMDPLVVAAFNRPIVFFMTRSDVFNTISKPILWTAHMLPIYRQQDGGDTKDRNKDTFRKSTEILKYGRNILIFGEGFTDDTFIRRLKPVKKGAARMGFGALEAINWSKKVYIAAVGNNYTDPELMRSELLISTSDKICLNDYREMYLDNHTQAINEVTRIIEERLKEQITHIENKDWAHFHEQIMMITRKGMNAQCHDDSIPLEKRWNYSRKLALWLNEKEELNVEQEELKNDLDHYFRLLKKMKLKDDNVFLKSRGQLNRGKEILKMILLFPVALLGLLHLGHLYLFIKRFVQNSFKRKVFWSSTKMVVGMIAMGLVNLPFIWIFHAFVYESWIAAVLYYLCIGLFGLAAYEWVMAIKVFIAKGKVQKADIQMIIEKRSSLEARIERLVPIG
jgi:hypothetical protein